MKSNLVIVFIAVIWCYLGYSWYPKWDKPWSEASISWDVSGYYHYLPAIFIYKDIRQQNWMEEINQKYLPSPAYDQAFGHHDSANKVNKYAIGQAVLYSPFFFAAHMYAGLSDDYPADGYSKPYQVSIWLGSLLFSVLGIILLRKILAHYFDDNIISLTLIALAVGTHWLEYAAINNGMNHTWLFTLLCLLILSTIRFYKTSDWWAVIGIGISIGLATLIRPTEMIWMFVPILWGAFSIKDRVTFLQDHWVKAVLAVVMSGAIIFIQLIYWKYAAGEWIVYSYGDQGFNWFQPKIWRGLMGVNIGWWIYTPIMVLAIPGWYVLYRKNKAIFWPTIVTSLLAIYITLSWSHFESGGGLGQRNLIQVYPLLAFPLASVFVWLNKSVSGKWIAVSIICFNIYYSGWWIYQAHQGGFFQAGQMTTPYFYNVVLRPDPDRDMFKLLDNNEYFKGTPHEMSLILINDFEQDSSSCTMQWKGSQAKCIDANNQFYGPIDVPIVATCSDWMRLEADFMMQTREWEVWKYAQWIVQFYKGDEVIKSNMIRVQRLMPNDQVLEHIYFDVRLPEQPFDRCTMTIWNAESSHAIVFDDLRVSCFKE